MADEWNRVGGAILALACAGPLAAGEILSVDLVEGLMQVELERDAVLVRATGTPGAFVLRDFAGLEAVGVDGGDAARRTIRFDFSAPVRIETLGVGIRAPGASEPAIRFETDLGVFSLGEDGAALAWNGSGTASIDALSGAGAAWTVGGGDVFGGAVSWVSVALPTAGRGGSADFGIRRVAFSSIPAPGALAVLLAICICGPARTRPA